MFPFLYLSQKMVATDAKISLIGRLTQFQEKYGSQVTKWDIFHYVYGMLHHPQYRELYKENSEARSATYSHCC